MVYSGAWGKLIHEKNQKSKILWHCPFKSLSLQISADEGGESVRYSYKGVYINKRPRAFQDKRELCTTLYGSLFHGHLPSSAFYPNFKGEGVGVGRASHLG